MVEHYYFEQAVQHDDYIDIGGPEDLLPAPAVMADPAVMVDPAHFVKRKQPHAVEAAHKRSGYKVCALASYVPIYISLSLSETMETTK